MSALQLPTGENILMSAFRSVVEGRGSVPTDFAAEYEKYFTSAVQPQSAQAQPFEKFSLTDPNIRVVVQSSSVPY